MSKPLEGEPLTPEQQVDQFLTLPREQQIAWMEATRQDSDTAMVCRLLNHDGAATFERNHVCGTYQEGWDDALSTLLGQYTQARQEQDAKDAA